VFFHTMGFVTCTNEGIVQLQASAALAEGSLGAPEDVTLSVLENSLLRVVRLA
jgi:hypothetical protein